MANATLAELHNIYNAELGHGFDPVRDAWWQNEGAAPADVVRANVRLSPEYAALPPVINNPGGYLIPDRGSPGDRALRGGQNLGGLMYDTATNTVSYSQPRDPGAPLPTLPTVTGLPPVNTVPPGGGRPPVQLPLPRNPGGGDEASAPPRPYKDASVQTQLNGVLSAGSPLMTQARTAAAQAANARGLRNSSIATGAGEEAALRVALAIASQDASQLHAENLSDQNFINTSALQNTALASQERLQGSSIASQERLSAAAITANAALQGLDAASRERINATDVIARQRLQDTLAAINVPASDRNNAQSALLTAQTNYANTIQSINGNAQMPSDVRAQQMENAANFLRASQNVIEQIYSIRIEWPTPGVVAPVVPAG